MISKPAIYDTSESRDLSVKNLISIFEEYDVSHIYYKILSPNDNSKNQPYMGSHLTDLSFIPTGEVTESTSTSQKTNDAKRRIKFLIDLDFSWVSSEGKVYSAPKAKLIYYPQYPEVRLSGFVTKCGFDMGGWMDPLKKGRTQGRILIIGVTKSEQIFAYLAVPDSRIAKEINDHPSIEISGVFSELNDKVNQKGVASKDILLRELRRIHLLGWIEGKKLSRGGIISKHSALNAGGTTLEAELGIIQNGFAGPDFMGWEIKQFGVKRCDLIDSKPLTLMTPEPDGGYYAEHSLEDFMRKYGYVNTKIVDRLDFTGRHIAGKVCEKSGLMLVTQGYDLENKVITDAAGCIALIDKNGNPASQWSFNKLLGHWKRKHAKAAYVPSLLMKEEGTNSYCYCRNIRLFEGTTFIRLLHAFTDSHVYYDPGINLKNISTKPIPKKRSQFRIKSRFLSHLYEKQTDTDLLS